VTWSPEAIKDVENIGNYIAQDSPTYAANVVDKLVDAGRKIKKFSKAGRIVPEIKHEMIRERPIYSYRVIYRIRGEIITIAAVVHGKRSLDSVIDRFQ